MLQALNSSISPGAWRDTHAFIDRTIRTKIPQIAVIPPPAGGSPA
jgi:hypothetical protein